MNGTRFRLIFLCAFIFLFSYVPCTAQEYPTEKEHKWAQKYYFGAFEEKFPLAESSDSLVSYRMYKDLYLEIEYSFEILNDPEKKKRFAIVRMADGAPIYEQMIMIRRKNPSATIKTIKSQLKIKQWRLNEETCPAISRQYDEFNELSLEVLSAQERADQEKGIATITLHPRMHTFRSYVSGGTMLLTLRDSEHPFIKWAEKTRSAFEACAAPQSK